MDGPGPAPKLVLVGRVRRPVGVRGEILVGPTGDDPDRFAAGRQIQVEGDPPRVLTVWRSRPATRGAWAVQFEGINTPEEAEKLRGLGLYVRPEDLPELPAGIYYHFQILGLEVVDVDGVVLGRVEAILETGSNDVYCVGKGETEVLVPAVPAMVARVDLEAGKILLSVRRSQLGGDDKPI